jgi:hypothetical protein
VRRADRTAPCVCAATRVDRGGVREESKLREACCSAIRELARRSMGSLLWVLPTRCLASSASVRRDVPGALHLAHHPVPVARRFDGDVAVLRQLREKMVIGIQIMRNANRFGPTGFIHGHEHGILLVSITTPELFHDRGAPRPRTRQGSASRSHAALSYDHIAINRIGELPPWNLDPWGRRIYIQCRSEFQGVK